MTCQSHRTSNKGNNAPKVAGCALAVSLALSASVMSPSANAFAKKVTDGVVVAGDGTATSPQQQSQR